MVIVIFVIGLMIAGQSTAPCDDACFRTKIAEEANVERDVDPYSDSWRHNR